MRRTARYWAYLTLGVIFFVPGLLMLVLVVLAIANPSFAASLHTSGPALVAYAVVFLIAASGFFSLMAKEGRLGPLRAAFASSAAGPDMEQLLAMAMPADLTRKLGVSPDEIRALMDQARRDGHAELRREGGGNLRAQVTHSRIVVSTGPTGLGGPALTPTPDAVHVVACASCGAPLQPSAWASQVRCPYCGNVDVVGS